MIKLNTEIEFSWPPRRAHPRLGEREVHAWAAALDLPSEQLPPLQSTLSPDEQARAGCFRFERDRLHFIVARGWLRAMLARYLELAPERIDFAYTARGKPFLAEPGGCGIHFNLSHSHGLAVLAVTTLCPVGVDVEQLRSLDDASRIAHRFFAPRESAGLDALPQGEQPTAFHQLWTRKEAWLKATGEGIGESLDQVEVSFLADEPARFLQLFGDSQAASQWSLFHLAPARGFVGALALPARDARVQCWAWQF